jgi:hypothetical protein
MEKLRLSLDLMASVSRTGTAEAAMARASIFEFPPRPERQPDFDRWFDRWYHAGSTVFKGEGGEAEFPPLHQMETQRAWLCGFGAAWAEAGEAERESEPVEVALANALTDRPTLLQQLRAHRLGWGNRTLN